MKRFLAIFLSLILLFSCSAAAFAGSAGYKTKNYRVPDTEALRFVENLGVGINLGNTFDAHSEGLTDELEYETVWSGAVTTPELIAEIKNAGFKTIRIPVSWHDHLTDTEHYTISEPWLDRVNEVVDYCLSEGLYVILNIHHDDGKNLLYPTKAKSAQSVKYITAIWTQLAERFKDYGEQLLFESMNEPRLVGCLYEWMLMPLSPTCIEAVRQVNAMNKAFVRAVRSAGGHNAERYLLCPGYDASADGALSPYYVLPDDPVKNDRHIIVAVHAYTPDSFSHQIHGVKKWSSKNLLDTAQITLFMDRLYCKYVSKGIPVLIDEFGALEKSGNLNSRIDYAGFYVANARARGMSCLWWDNNLFTGDGERFGLIDRATNTWVYPGIVKALIENS